MKDQKPGSDLSQTALELINKFTGASPRIQKGILSRISEVIENEKDVEIKGAFIKLRGYLESPAKQAAADLEQSGQTKDDNSAFFESDEQHRAETIRALEEIKKLGGTAI